MESQEAETLTKSTSMAKAAVNKFNPESDYSWQAKDEFPITGKELEFLHNTLGSIFSANVPPAQMYIMLNECFKISSDVIKRNVEIGTIKIVEPQNTSEQEVANSTN